ncbi:MAG: hypothetical protein V4534_08815 [Myxococcota bacterium]
MRIVLLLSFGVSLWAQTQSPQCQPIEFGSDYTLDEGLTGDASQNSFSLSNTEITIKPGCAAAGGYIDLYHQNTVATFTNERPGPGFDSLAILSACTGRMLFGVVSKELGFNIVNPGGSCMAKVLPADNLANQVVLRNCSSGDVLAFANKTFVSETNAQWDVSIRSTGVAAQAIPYLLAMKDNGGFSCANGVPRPVAADANWPKSAIIVATVSACTIVFGIAGFVLYKRYNWGRYQALARKLDS